MVRTQVPGYYRLVLGDFEITALNDGGFDLPADPPIAAAHLQFPGIVRLKANAKSRQFVPANHTRMR